MKIGPTITVLRHHDGGDGSNTAQTTTPSATPAETNRETAAAGLVRVVQPESQLPAGYRRTESGGLVIPDKETITAEIALKIAKLNANAVTESGTPVAVRAVDGPDSAEAVLILAQAGADLNKPDPTPANGVKGRTPLVAAILNGSEATLDVLGKFADVDYNVQVETVGDPKKGKGNKTTTASHLAVDRTGSLDRLIDRVADDEAATKREGSGALVTTNKKPGEAPTHRVPNFKAQDSDGNTPLMSAIKSDNLSNAKEIFDTISGKDSLKITDNDGDNPAHVLAGKLLLSEAPYDKIADRQVALRLLEEIINSGAVCLTEQGSQRRTVIAMVQEIETRGDDIAIPA